MTTTEIAIAVVAFAIGALLAALMARSRSRSMANKLNGQIRSVQEESDGRARELSEQKSATQDALAQLQAARDEIAHLTSQVAILETQLQEASTAALDMEDRLNASEARLLTADAVIDQNRADLVQWGLAYQDAQLAHAGLQAEHIELIKRREELEDELADRRLELDRLTVRLDDLLATESGMAGTAEQRGELLRSVAATVLAQEDARAALRRRELDLAEVQSHLNAMRFSINVLTKTGAELAQRLLDVTTIDAAEAAQPARISTSAAPVAVVAGDAAADELLDLRGIIGDWFADVEPNLHFDPHLLLLFGGSSAPATALPVPSQRIDDLQSGGAIAVRGEPEGVVAHAPELPASVQLAALKAASNAALDRARRQQLELVERVNRSTGEYDGVVEEVEAWRSMLYATLGTDPEMRAQLDAMAGAPPEEAIPALATVAVVAYQRKAEAAERLQKSLSAGGSSSAASAQARMQPRVQPAAPGLPRRTALDLATAISRSILRGFGQRN